MKRTALILAITAVLALPVDASSLGEGSSLLYRGATKTAMAAVYAKVPHKYLLWLEKYCHETGAPLWFMCRLGWAESRWNYKAKNLNKDENGATLSIDRGLYQHNSKWTPDFALRFNDGIMYDPYDPESSIKISCRIVSALMRKNKGDMFRVITDWNGTTGKAVLPFATVRLLETVLGDKT